MMNATETENFFKKSINDFNCLDDSFHENSILQSDCFNNILEELTIQDYLLAVSAGIVGGIISSLRMFDENNRFNLQETLNKVHMDASSNSPKHFLGKLFHHKSDWMDIPGDGFVKRDYKSGVFAGLHRLYFGHDILSLQSDNPIYLMTKQYGIRRGVCKLTRHLIGDSFSRNGLPLPASSWLDINIDGSPVNIIDLASKNALKGTDINNVSEAYQQLFTIKMQDIISQGATWAIVALYIKLSGIKRKVNQSQIKLIAYATSFFFAASSGFIRFGIPYINWPTLSMIVKEYIALSRNSYKETEELEKITDNLVRENVDIELKVFEFGSHFPSYNNGNDYIKEFDSGYNNFKAMTLLFGED